MKSVGRRVVERVAGSALCSAIARRTVGRIPLVLMYHRVGNDPTGRQLPVTVFEEQLRQLRNANARFRTVRDLCDAVRHGKPMESGTVVLTFDDGYEDFATGVLPALKRHGIPATLFVSTDFLDGSTWLWTDYIHYALVTTSYRECTLAANEWTRNYSLRSMGDIRTAWSDIADHCMTLRPREIRTFLGHLARELRVEVPSRPVPHYRALSWDQVREAAREGVEIGSHGRSHYRMVLFDSDELREETAGSRERLEDRLDLPVRSFCYPYGGPEDMNSEVKAAVREAGYESAAVAYFDTDVLGDLYELKRYSAGPDMRRFASVISRVSLLPTAAKSIFRPKRP